MSKRYKHFVNTFFTLNKSEQRGIFILVALILIVLSMNLLMPYFFQTEKTDPSAFFNEIENFRQSQQFITDSIRIERLQNRGELDYTLANEKLKPFPFNPNRLPEELWQKIGLTKKQIKSIKNYEAKGGKFRRKTDLKKMYAISEIEYTILEPYIRIPSSFKSRSESQIIDDKLKYENTKRLRTTYKLVEVNTCDSTALTNNLKLSPWLARRVIKYRTLLGGFYSKIQIAEVYGFDSAQLARRMNFISVDTSKIQKLNINTGTFKQLLRHPYVSYEITQYIVNTRLEKGPFKSTEALMDDEVVSEMLYRKLRYYLTTE